MVVFHFTPEQIRAKIENNIRSEGDCLIWTRDGKVTSGGPIVKIRANGKYNTLDVHRYLYELHNGQLSRKDKIRTNCSGGIRCVQESHLERVSGKLSILERIERSVTKQDNGCHTWNLKTFTSSARPVISYSGEKSGQLDVQRFLWKTFREDITEKTRIDLTCDTKDLNCCNIEHFKAVPAKLGLTLEDDWRRLLTHTYEKDGCLLWTGYLHDGYGMTTIRGDEKMTAHRASYIIKTKIDYIPRYIDGHRMHIRHSCPHRHCIKPTHLFLGTASDNMFDDMLRDGKLHKARTLDGVLVTEELASKIKLSKRKVDDIGYTTATKRARLYGVNPSLVYTIDAGKSWSHLLNFYGENHLQEKTQMREAARLARIIAREKVWTNEEFERAGEELYQMVKKTSANKKRPIDGDCWEYTGTLMNGYGVVFKNNKRLGAHVLSCEIKNKRHVEDDEVTRHLCANKKCVRDSHLEFGTYSENACDEFGEDCTRTQLNPSKVRIIRASTKTDRELAEEYDVPRHTIYKARMVMSWKHVK